MPRNPGDDEAVIGVTEFKGKSLGLIEAVATGKLTRVILTKHGKPIAALTPLGEAPVDLWGALKDSVHVAEGVDLTEPTGEAWDADE